VSDRAGSSLWRAVLSRRRPSSRTDSTEIARISAAPIAFSLSRSVVYYARRSSLMAAELIQSFIHAAAAAAAAAVCHRIITLQKLSLPRRFCC